MRADVLATACRMDVGKLLLGQRGPRAMRVPWGPVPLLQPGVGQWVAPGAAPAWGLSSSLGMGTSRGQAGTELWRAADQHCCSITEAGADSPGR